MIRSIRIQPAKALYVLASLLVLSAVPAHAQNNTDQPGSDSELWRMGAYGGTQWIDYDADMAGLPGVPTCCPRYRGGTGSGLSFGVSVEAPIVNNVYGGFRLLYTGYEGTVSAEEYELVTSERDTTTATFGHTIEMSQPVFATEATFSVAVLPQLRVQAGARVDVMLGGTYRQQERIITPDNIRFENGLRTRMMYDGTLPREAPTHLAVTAGVRYDFPLNEDHSLMLSPEVQIWQGFEDLILGTDLTMRGLRVGLNLYYITRSERTPSPLDPGRD